MPYSYARTKLGSPLENMTLNRLNFCIQLQGVVLVQGLDTTSKYCTWALVHSRHIDSRPERFLLEKNSWNFFLLFSSGQKAASRKIVFILWNGQCNSIPQYHSPDSLIYIVSSVPVLFMVEGMPWRQTKMLWQSARPFTKKCASQQILGTKYKHFCISFFLERTCYT